jgi:high-affinity iron transporter
MRSAAAGRRSLPGGVAVLGVLAALLTGACDGNSAPVTSLSISTSSCVGGSWSMPADGRLAVTLRNTGRELLQVDLVDSAGTGVFAHISALVPGTTRPVGAHLPNGDYRWECNRLGESRGTPLKSAVRQVKAASGAVQTALIWVTSSQEQQLARSFAMALGLRLTQVRASVAELDAAVASGDLSRARSLWLVAHGRYQTLLGGGRAGFGEADTAIDGFDEGLAGGVRDPKFTGFHRLEYLLWNGGSRQDLRAASSRLLGDATALAARSRFLATPLAQITGQSYALLEQILRVQLNGRGDYGSHSQLADLSADLACTRDLLVRLEPLLRPRDPRLGADAQAGADTLANQLQDLQRPDGVWPALNDLTSAQRDGVVALTRALVEVLARVPMTVRASPAANPD